MRNFFYSFILVLCFQITTWAQISINYQVSPSSFDEDEQITLTFPDIDSSTWGVSSTHALYLWAWSFDTDGISKDCPTNGTWGVSSETNKLTYDTSTGKYSITFTPKTFFGRTKALSKFGFLVKTVNGSNQSQDILLTVGKYSLTLVSPADQSVNVLSTGSKLDIKATSTQAATYVIKANGTQVYSTSAASVNLNYTYTVTGDATIEVTGTSSVSGISQTKSFVIRTSSNSAAIPSWIQQGINYSTSDPTKIGLAIYAPGKSYIHVIGSFNNWAVSPNYLMKRDTENTDLFWIEITGLTSQQIYTFQYLTSDGIRVADPYSRLVLSPDDDPGISSTTYPNLPTYPSGQKFDVSVVQTGMPAYNWKNSTFIRPAKEKLAVYELLVRDFTEEKNWQSLIDKIPYIKSLNMNAIELLPVMEFEGNNSWGYNPSFHYALDKAYGTSDKFKEFIDTCHQNGIAVILDIALNHATQRNPLVRLWNVDPDGDGYGTPSADNPYFNTVAKHAYNVSEDFNHSSTWTHYYVKRVLEQWMTEYKIDGFRWDLTKGFTQNCTANDETCTNAYQQDRVNVLKLYADYQWNIDPSFYIIFEHLGTDTEEQQWANYKIDEGKGIMMWNNLNTAYTQTTMGYTENSSINRVNYELHGFTGIRNMAYAESHDEERLMYKNIQYGNASGSYNIKDLNTALSREKGIGAILLAVPGPKMIWQFGELGYDYSINWCANGSISSDCRTDAKPVAFKLKYDQDANRKAIYNTWSKILDLKAANEVFNTKTFDVQSGDLKPRIYIWNTNTSEALNYVVIVANYTTTAQNVIPYLPNAGTWYNLLDNSPMSFAATTTPISLQPGEFRILGNATAKNLDTDDTAISTKNMQFSIIQNPASNGEIKIKYQKAKGGTVYLYDLSGVFIKSYKINADTGEQTLSANGLKAGLYLLQLKSENGAVTAKVIIK